MFLNTYPGQTNFHYDCYHAVLAKVTSKKTGKIILLASFHGIAKTDANLGGSPKERKIKSVEDFLSLVTYVKIKMGAEEILIGADLNLVKEEVFESVKKFSLKLQECKYKENCKRNNCDKLSEKDKRSKTDNREPKRNVDYFIHSEGTSLQKDIRIHTNINVLDHHPLRAVFSCCPSFPVQEITLCDTFMHEIEE